MAPLAGNLMEAGKYKNKYQIINFSNLLLVLILSYVFWKDKFIGMIAYDLWAAARANPSVTAVKTSENECWAFGKTGIMACETNFIRLDPPT